MGEKVCSAKKRIREYFYQKEMNLKDAEKQCGFARGFLSTGGVVGSDKLEKLVKAFPDIDLYWVVTGVKHTPTNNGSSGIDYKEAYQAAMVQIKTLSNLIDTLSKK